MEAYKGKSFFPKSLKLFSVKTQSILFGYCHGNYVKDTVLGPVVISKLSFLVLFLNLKHPKRNETS